jgi:hypothetical protein
VFQKKSTKGSATPPREIEMIQKRLAAAKGEAESNRIRLASLTPQMLELRKLEKQRALIEKWNGQLPTVESAGNGSGLLLQLPKQ